MLLSESHKSYPTFDRLQARRIFAADNPQIETLRISVFLTYQGRSALRHQFNFGFDPEELDYFLFDDPVNKAGLANGVSVIGNELTETLRMNLGMDPLNLAAFGKIDATLLQFYHKNMAPSEEAEAEEEAKQAAASAKRPTSSQSSTIPVRKARPGLAFVKACSEAIFFAVGACLRREQSLASSIKDNLHPVVINQAASMAETKLLVNVFSGGKAAGSSVKFAHFYLIVDGHANPELNLMGAYKAFLTYLKSKFTTAKGGETAHKLLPDGSFFNAYGSIADTFKFLEESINASAANGRPETNPGSSKRAGTALSGEAKSRDGAAGVAASVADQMSDTGSKRPVFRLGVNCDASSLFNKDPKDPNKYEVEGMKTQTASAQLVEYYVKMCQDHPLLTYLEDPMADADMDGYRKLREALRENGLNHVQIGMRSIFKETTLGRVQDVTSVRPLTAEEQKLEQEAREEEAKRPPTNEKPGKGKEKDKTTIDSAMSGYKSPNYDKFTPHCVCLRTSAIATTSDLFDFFRYNASLYDEARFTFVIDDRVNEEVQSEADCAVVDLGIGLGCEYVMLKGCAKPERAAKINHYAGLCAPSGATITI